MRPAGKQKKSLTGNPSGIFSFIVFDSEKTG
jgi:hypothetical protein